MKLWQVLTSVLLQVLVDKTVELVLWNCTVRIMKKAIY